MELRLPKTSLDHGVGAQGARFFSNILDLL